MVNGTKSADFQTFQEAASLASLLIEVRVSMLGEKIPCCEVVLERILLLSSIKS